MTKESGRAKLSHLPNGSPHSYICPTCGGSIEWNPKNVDFRDGESTSSRRSGFPIDLIVDGVSWSASEATHSATFAGSIDFDCLAHCE